MKTEAERLAAREAEQEADRRKDREVIDAAIAALQDDMSRVIPATGDADIDRLNCIAEADQRAKTSRSLRDLLERRARLLGLDAPTRSEVSVTGVALDELDEMRKVAEANERGSAGGLARAVVAKAVPGDWGKPS